MDQNIQRRDIFATAVWESSLPDFEKQKETIITALKGRRNQDPIGVYKSNYGGYQSVDDLTNCAELAPFFQHLMNNIVPSVINDCSMSVGTGSITQCWVNFNDRLNALNMPHTHGDVLSGAFYINLPIGSGNLVLQNRNVNDLWKGLRLIDLKDEKTIFNPYIKTHFAPPIVEGSIYVWHSYLEHYVVPNATDVERISISFNIDLS